MQTNELPQQLYALFFDYHDNDRSTSMVVFKTREERKQDMLYQLHNNGIPVRDDMSEDELAELFDTHCLLETGGSVYLEDLDLVRGAWVSEA